MLQVVEGFKSKDKQKVVFTHSSKKGVCVCVCVCVCKICVVPGIVLGSGGILLNQI